MIKIARTLATAVALVAATAATASAQFTVYNTRAGFEAALGSFYVDNFTGNAISTSGASIGSTTGSFGSNRWNDIAERGTSQTMWTFVGGTIAFGGEWDLSAGGAAQGLELSVNWLAGGTSTLGTQIPNNYTGEFFGFIANAAMLNVIVTGGTQGGFFETHSFDNMTTSTVPEPSTYVLMAAGLGMIGVLSRRRRV